MDLNLIKKPVITEKSTANAQFNKYIFEVTKDANKTQIKARNNNFLFCYICVCKLFIMLPLFKYVNVSCRDRHPNCG